MKTVDVLVAFTCMVHITKWHLIDALSPSASLIPIVYRIIIISLFRMAPIQRQRRRGLHTVHQVRLQQFRKSVLRQSSCYGQHRANCSRHAVQQQQRNGRRRTCSFRPLSASDVQHYVSQNDDYQPSTPAAVGDEIFRRTFIADTADRLSLTVYAVYVHNVTDVSVSDRSQLIAFSIRCSSFRYIYARKLMRYFVNTTVNVAE